MTVSLNGMTLPSWASHLQHKLAPPPLLLVQAYVNTLDLDLHTDMLAHADEAQAWLADVLARIAEHPAHKLDELLPWNWRPITASSDIAA